MTSGADLFVVCKQCGSEVSPVYHRVPLLRHPAAPEGSEASARERAAPPAGARSRLGAVLGRGSRSRSSAPRPSSVGYGSGRWEGTRPYATIVLVAAAAGLWVAAHARPSLRAELAIVGPLDATGGGS